MVSIHTFGRADSMDWISVRSIEGEQKTLQLQQKIVKSAVWVTPGSLDACIA